jgi:hypothetical protein
MLNQCILVGRLITITQHLEEKITIKLNIEDSTTATELEIDIPKNLVDITEMIKKDSLIAIKGKIVQNKRLKILAERISILKSSGGRDGI